MRRRPDEDDQEQDQRRRTHFVGHRGPAKQRWHRARRAADHDVLGRRRLQDDGVDHRIADEGAQRQPQGERIHENIEHPRADAAQHAGKRQGTGGADLTACQGARAGARHPGVDATLDQAVEGKPRGRQQRDTGQAEHQDAPGHHRLGRQQHADQRAERGEQHDPRLGELEIIVCQASQVERQGGLGVHQGLGGESKAGVRPGIEPVGLGSLAPG